MAGALAAIAVWDTHPHKNEIYSCQPEEEAENIFETADVNTNGEINYTKFISALFPVASDGVASCYIQIYSSLHVSSRNTSNLTLMEMAIQDAFNNVPEVDTLPAIADINGDGKTNLEELMELLGAAPSKAVLSTVSSSFMILNSADQAKATFKKFDTNNDEHLERNKLKNVLCFAGAHPSKQEAAVIFRKGDIDEDGKIEHQHNTARGVFM